ncbi:endonuclease MutS2 [candidate division KSB1 bacterium]|nr:endonuclease MutS2 [candidate division KSB1 bacterium]
MDTALFDILEFNKILNHLANCALSPITRQRFLSTVPSTDAKWIERSLSLVTEFRTIIDAGKAFPIDAFDDITHSIQKARTIGNFLNPAEILQLKKISVISRRIYAFLRKDMDIYPLLIGLAEQLVSLLEVENEISRTIDEETVQVKDTASDTLKKLRNQILTTESRIRKKLESIQKTWAEKGYLQENLVTLRDGRMVLMVKEGQRSRAQGIVYDQSSSGATLYMEPIETLEMNNQIRRLRLEEEREVERILTELTDRIREHADAFLNNLNCLATFDHISARAQLSAEISGSQPIINQSNKINLLQARHPLLLLRQLKRDHVVPLNLEIGEKFNCLVITGPNAGGKTVAIKTVGLLHLMVQSGFHVPVFPDSEFSLFEDIFADIGDMQSIENDLSTFSSRIKQLKHIIQSAGKRSLVLIDEIGSGTDPEEGAAFAKAVLEKLNQTGCITIVTTHHGSLKAFAHVTSGIENGSMEFDKATLEPTYRFRIGIPGSSYAFEIAQRLGIPKEIIQRARTYVGADKAKLEDLISILDHQISRHQKLADDLKRKQLHLDELTNQYQELTEKHHSEEKRLKKKAIEEAEQIVKRANAAVELAIKEIREKHATREAIKSAKELIGEQLRSVSMESRNLTKLETTKKEKIPWKRMKPEEIEPGQHAYWVKFKLKVTIRELQDASGKVQIESGSMKIRVPLSELRMLPDSQAAKTKTAPFQSHSYTMPDKISTEIDLRGMRLEDAIDEVDKFIDSALLAGLTELRIIHGKGTGVLKNGINQFLKSHPRVKRKSQAAWNEGDAGATLIELED